MVDVIQTIITWTVPMIYLFAVVKERLQYSHEFLTKFVEPAVQRR